MANEEHVSFVRNRGHQSIGWLSGNRATVLDLSNADFNGADLQGTVLLGANLSGAKLIGANLEDASLSGANLYGADLSGAILSEANLAYGNLGEVNLSLANLEGAKLQGANLSRANLSGANLSLADLSKGAMPAAMWVNDILRGVRGGARRTNLTGANLSAARFEGANLTGADFTESDLSNAQFPGADLSEAIFSRARIHQTSFDNAYLIETDFRNTVLVGARFVEAILWRADFSNARFTGGFLSRASLRHANLTETIFKVFVNLNGVDLQGANLTRAELKHQNLSDANLSRADLTGADLSNSSLERARLVETNLRHATVSGCRVYGASAWNVATDEHTEQQSLVISPENEPAITVDSLEVAQFIYLLVRNEKIRSVIDSLTSKAVLILGRFSEVRKAVLEAVRNKLRVRNYIPILFDFDKPATRDTHETITTLARIARFVIADVTDAKCIPQELVSIVEQLPSLPVQPILETGGEPWGMYDHIKRYPWVLPLYRYDTTEALLTNLEAKVIGPAEKRAQEARDSETTKRRGKTTTHRD